MKKLYTLSAAVLAGAVLMSASPRHDIVSKRFFKTHATEAASRSEAVWRPAMQQMYVWYYGEWMLEETNKMSYDSRGNMLEDFAIIGEDEGVTRSVFTYNDEGLWASRITENSSDMVNFRNSEKTLREFDPIVKNFVTATYGYNWLNGEWQQTGNNWEREVTRNADGNVTKVERKVLYNGEFDPTYRFIAEYGEDGKVSKMYTEELTSNGFDLYWEQGDVYTDIVWNRADGQLMSDDELMSGNNRIESAHVTNEDGDDLTMNVEYTDELGSLVCDIKGTVSGIRVTSHIVLTMLDEYGSYEQVSTDTYVDGDYTETLVNTRKYSTDDSGLDLLVYSSETFEGEEEIFEWYKADLTRDAEGRPAEYIQQYYEDGAFENSFRIVFNDYVDVAGIGSVEADSDAPVQLYDLRGMQVTGDAAPGIYIRRQGNKVSKIVIR